MNFEEYRRQAEQAHTDSTLQDRKSFLRLFGVWLKSWRDDSADAVETVEDFKSLDANQKREIGFADCDPETFEEVNEFILTLYNEFDYSRTMRRHYYDAIESYCKRMGVEFYDSDQFLRYREDNLSTPNNPNFDQTTVFTLDELRQLVDALDPPHRDFILIQYIHCRRPGEVKDLKSSDFDFDRETVTYNIKKQKYGEDNRRNADIVNERERDYLKSLIEHNSEYLFPRAYMDLEKVRKPFRNERDDLGLEDLPLKNLRHTRISQLKAVGWESEEIRDTYTHHKQLSTLQNRYLSSVDEELTEEELWSVIP